MSWKRKEKLRNNPIIIINQDNKTTTPPSHLLAPPSLANSSLLLSTPSFSSSVSTLASMQSAQTCPSLEFSYINIVQKQNTQIKELQQDLAALNKKCIQQMELTKQTELQKLGIEQEVQELSQYLFKQVDIMVTNEKQAQLSVEHDLVQAQNELSEAQEQLKKERAQLKQLKKTMGHEEETKRSRIDLVDKEELELFREIFTPSTSLEHLYRLPFLKLCYATDVYPCLRSGFSRSTIKRVLDSIIHQPCFIEAALPHQHQGTKRLSLVARLRSSMSQCYGCGSRLDKQTEVFHFKLKEQEVDWQYIDRACRNRLVAVCDFYSFIRHVRLGLQAARDLDTLFEECFQLRLNMFYARSGTDIEH